MKESKANPASLTMMRMQNVNEYYKILDKVGRGTYGTVYKVKGLKDGHFYAIKKLQNNDTKLQQQGFPITALRGTIMIVPEITLLKQIDHPNIIKLNEIIVSRPNKRNLLRGSTFLVFEYMHHDFAGLFKVKTKFQLTQIKCIIKQLLEGVGYLHRNKILHRDIKSANILLSDEGDVKLADFGLGRKVRFQNLFTYKVVTLWYRAPQLLLGYKTYSDKIDIWSVGCVVSEFFTGEVLFRKEAEYAQMERIYEIVGDFQANDMKINQESYKIYQNLQDLRPKKSYSKEIGNYLRKNCPQISAITIDFIERLVHLDPSKRMSCQQALRHPFFSQKPLACNKSQIQKMEFECHQMPNDPPIKIVRALKRDDEHNKHFYRIKDHNNDRDINQRREIDVKKNYRHHREEHDHGHRLREGRNRDDHYYQSNRHQKYHSSDKSSPQNKSGTFSSSSHSSEYSSSKRSRSRYDEHRHRDDDRKSRDQRKNRDDHQHYDRQEKKRLYRKDDRRYLDKHDRERKGKDIKDQKYHKNDNDQRRYRSNRDYRKRDEEESRRDYKDDYHSMKKSDKKYQRREDQKEQFQRRDEKKDDRRDERKEDRRDQRKVDDRRDQRKDDRRDQRKDDRRDQRKQQKRDQRKDERRDQKKQQRRDDRKQDKRDYRERKQDWRRDSKQKKYEKYQKGSMHESKNTKYYQQRDYKRRQQRWDQKNAKPEKEKYQNLQKHGDYARRDEGSEKRNDKYYFVSGKNAYKKKENHNSNSSERSSNGQFKKDKDYSRHKPAHYERNQRKPYYKKQHQGSNDHRSH